MQPWPKAIITAFIFLTRLPMPQLASIEPEDEGRSLACFPVVGLAIGLILCGFALITSHYFDAGVTAALTVMLWAAITGGLHLDGLADSADGWMGGLQSIERTLEIMHDSRNGTGAVVAVCCLLIVKFALLTAVIESQLWLALIIAPVLGRCVAPLLFIPGSCFYLAYVQPSGIAKNFIEHCPDFSVRAALAAALVCALFAGSFWGAVQLLSACALALLLLRRLMVKRLGGSTGDTAGASTEIIEAVVLLVLV